MLAVSVVFRVIGAISLQWNMPTSTQDYWVFPQHQVTFLNDLIFISTNQLGSWQETDFCLFLAHSLSLHSQGLFPTFPTKNSVRSKILRIANSLATIHRCHKWSTDAANAETTADLESSW